ncbi:MAG: nucleotidyltransferase domain-containing protein, partial [Alphaproteobacteria bacterium]|nr:nucleotidyltransferase domain-containing protein [Alphaproteobacteria bacterium]
MAHIREIILEELQAKIASAGSARSGRYKILKLILFGSFAKGTWFDDKHSGRASDFDLLVIVSHRELTDMSAFWEEVEDRLFSDPLVKRDVSLIVHTLPDVNRQLKDGQYFFSEIVNQGILLYEDAELGKDGKAKNILTKSGKANAARAF